jgi:mycothione reductase
MRNASLERFDVLVIGSGSGMIVVSNAVASGLKVALVESGPMGGTCLNRGCIPSKMLIYPADVVNTIKEAENLGIHAAVNSIDFTKIMTRMRQIVDHDSEEEARGTETNPNVRWFKDTGQFIADYTMKVGDQTLTASRIFIVSGARPDVPPVKGLRDVGYITSDTVLALQTQPGSMIIMGGGYVATEYGHFFSSMGTKVTIIQRNPTILTEEEPEVAELMTRELAKRIEIFTNFEGVEARETENLKTVVARNVLDGNVREFSGEALLVATGRVPNSDTLKPEKTGVELDAKGFIKVNEYLETTKKNVWAFGDAIGKQMFKHVANFEAEVAWHNAVHDHKVKMEYDAAPHAVFSHPQAAAVGLKEAEANQKGYKILVGKAFYRDTAQGAAMGNPEGFVKVIVERGTGKILGGHIIGPYASILIQEIINAMVTEERTFLPIIRGLHIHPAMSEVVQKAFGNLKEVD